jgi:hypothetical protein
MVNQHWNYALNAVDSFAPVNRYTAGFPGLDDIGSTELIDDKLDGLTIRVLLRNSSVHSDVDSLLLRTVRWCPTEELTERCGKFEPLFILPSHESSEGVGIELGDLARR